MSNNDNLSSSEALEKAKNLFTTSLQAVSENPGNPDQNKLVSVEEGQGLRKLMSHEDNEKFEVFMDEESVRSHDAFMDSVNVSPALRSAMEAYVNDGVLRMTGRPKISTEERGRLINDLSQKELHEMYSFVNSEVAQSMLRCRLRAMNLDPNQLMKDLLAQQDQSNIAKAGAALH